MNCQDYLVFSKINQLHARAMVCRSVEEACLKVGQTFLSALLIALLPRRKQKKGLRRLSRPYTRSCALPTAYALLGRRGDCPEGLRQRGER